MAASRESAHTSGLEIYFDGLRLPDSREILKRAAAHWRIYAAAAGSAVAMTTGAVAASIGTQSPEIEPDQAASVRPAGTFASLRAMPAARAVRAATAPQANQATQGAAPAISASGVVPIYGTGNMIQPGEWITIYGTNLAATTAMWNGDFPTSLGGTSVQINGKLAYLMFVSPGQINLQAPDDTATGTVSVTVVNGNGTATSTVTLNSYAPSFSLQEVTKDGSGYVAGIILRSDHSGAFGGGSYDILGPTGNFFGYRTVAARPGDTVELFGVGFGPTNPAVPAGKPFSGAAAVENPFTLYINNVAVQPAFVGISSAGLYQINLVVPTGLGENEVPLMAMAGGMQTQAKVLFSLAGNGSNPGGTFGTAGGSPGGFSFGPPSFGGSSGGPGSGGSGGGGGSGSVHRKHRHWTPTLKFPPK